MAFTKTPHSSSYQIKWYDPTKEGNARFCEDEFGDEAEALAATKDILVRKVSEQVSIVRWHHTYNNPGCLPEIRSNCCSLTNYNLSEDGELVINPINIFG